MRIIVFSDENYLPVVQNLVYSIDLILPGSHITYYMVGFHRKNCLVSSNTRILYKTFIPKGKFPNLNFLKPSILLQSISDHGDNDFLFLDSDITIGKRFELEKFRTESSPYPLSPYGPFELPYTYRYFPDGKTETYTPDLLMSYFNVTSKSMRYVQNCIISYNRTHYDFMLEWESICTNRFLLREDWKYFPFQDETAFNVLLWKYESENNLGHIFINTHKKSTYELVESNDWIIGLDIDDNPYERCETSSSVMLYHGTKDEKENIKIQRYIYENSTGYSGSSTNPT